jgi:hypothetical protein
MTTKTHAFFLTMDCEATAPQQILLKEKSSTAKEKSAQTRKITMYKTARKTP